MILRRLLRALAVLIAVLAFADPAITRRVPLRQPMTVVTMDVRDVPHAERLQRRLSERFDVAIQTFDPTSLAAACPPTGGCLIVSRGAVPRRLSAGATVLGALHVRDDAESRSIADVAAPQTVHRDAASIVHVSLTEPVGRVDVFDGDVLVGSAEPGEALNVDVTWVPLETGARALRVVAGEDVEDIGVIVEATPATVFVHELEPTWLGTFVRRALEDDPRFVVVGRTRVAPPVTISRGGAGPLSVSAIGDAAVVVVTAPHALGASDVDLLARFVTDRGGTLMVVPDRRPSGAITRLLPPVAGQLRDAQPRKVGLLQVREWLTFDPGVGTTTLAALGGDAVVMSRAMGRGRVIVSGALDAWRFRDASSNFNTFWTNLAWMAATAAGKPLHLTADAVLSRPGEPVHVEAARQSIERPPRQSSAVGSMICNGQRQAVRLWPGSRPGTFEGTLRPTGEGECELRVTIDDTAATLPLAVRTDVRGGRSPQDALDAAVAAHEGVVAEVGEGEARLVTRASEQLPARMVDAPVRPMRSPLWLLVFAANLIGEWWLRRRAGLS